MDELKWSLDALTIKDNALFGFGWVFHPSCAIEASHIELSFLTDGKEGIERIGIDSLKARTDVATAHPNHVHALYSGFVFLGATTPNRQLTEIQLICKLANGNECSVVLPLPEGQTVALSQDSLSIRWQQMRQLGRYWRRAFSMLRAGQWSILVEKLRRHLKARPQGELKCESELAQHLSALPTAQIAVIVDHDLGGGANHYRQRYVDKWVAGGGVAIVFTYHLASLTSVIIVKSQLDEKRLSVPDPQFFLHAVSKLPVAEVVYNTAVSLANPLTIALLLVGIQKACRAKLKVLVHDFYLVCPSHFLINDAGQYCGIPQVSQCTACLKSNPHGFVSLFPERDMVKWRATWGAMLMAADEIVAFSNNSAQLLRKAYPQILPSRIAIVPHHVDYLPKQTPKITQLKRLHIGVLGQIGFHKGALVVAALAAAIKQQGVDARITVFGTIEARCDKDVLAQTGTYRHNDLPFLIERSDANIFLFPSICPETFSYVVQELMEMKLPVAAFNFGAPAERLAVYDQSLILESLEPKALLSSLLAFHQKIYLSN